MACPVWWPESGFPARCSRRSARPEVVALLRASPGSSPGPFADTYREIGRLLTQAHASLRDDFEVSWPEADAAVEAAVGAGAYGAW
jgi:galactokinase